ncbi:hypothetical protein E8E12_005135 [Didymella heteroderae]|uniref:Uncharacterized protein n=1 Tax=Didymella heteroderae TaxID=1769908 RepID=A0A9P5BZ60_9PLEO|nr:hypothetical protein E8E12_005135 [Didymella heteroderae]
MNRMHFSFRTHLALGDIVRPAERVWKSKASCPPPKNGAIFSNFPRDSVADISPLAFSSADLNTREGLRVAPPSGSSLTAEDNFNDFHHLLDQLGITGHGDQQYAQRVTSDRPTDYERLAESAEGVWGKFQANMHERHQGQQQTLVPMPSGIEGLCQVVTGSPVAPPTLFFPTSARAPPLGLNGNEDPATDVIRDDEWHGGPEAIEQRVRRDEIQSATANIAQRINAKIGIIEVDKNKEETRK